MSGRKLIAHPRRNKMRRTVITAAVLVTIIIVLRAASVMTADVPERPWPLSSGIPSTSCS